MKGVNSESEMIDFKIKELNWMIKTTKQIKKLEPKFFRKKYEELEEDQQVYEEDIRKVKREYFLEQMDPNRQVAQLEKGQKRRAPSKN